MHDRIVKSPDHQTQKHNVGLYYRVVEMKDA